MQVVVTLAERRWAGEGARAGQGRQGWGTETRLTSSPQSVPQLFLMAQKGMPEPGEQCGVQRVRNPNSPVRAPSTLHSPSICCGLWRQVLGEEEKARQAHLPPSWRPGVALGEGGTQPPTSSRLFICNSSIFHCLSVPIQRGDG